MNDIKISQSLLKDYEKDACKYRVKLKYIDGNRLPFDPDNVKARDKGHFFELLVLGKGTGDSDLLQKWPKSAKGLMLSDEKKVRELADEAKKILKEKGLKWTDKDVDVEIEHKDLRGRVDFIPTLKGNAILSDLKYTETKPDERWNEYAWGDLDKIDYTQAIHYVTINYLNTGEVWPFYYIVFSPYGNGWSKFIRVEVSKEAMSAHIERIKSVKERLLDETWDKVDDYNECKSCEFRHLCDNPAKAPKDLVVSL